MLVPGVLPAILGHRRWEWGCTVSARGRMQSSIDSRTRSLILGWLSCELVFHGYHIRCITQSCIPALASSRSQKKRASSLYQSHHPPHPKWSLDVTIPISPPRLPSCPQKHRSPYVPPPITSLPLFPSHTSPSPTPIHTPNPPKKTKHPRPATPTPSTQHAHSAPAPQAHKPAPSPPPPYHADNTLPRAHYQSAPSHPPSRHAGA